MVVTLQDLAPFEALARARAEFLGQVSHELRAPLAAIKGSAATARGAAPDLDPAEALQFLRIVEEQADRMDGLIRDLLDAGRIGAGMLAVDPVPAELTGLVERARTAFTGGGARHGIVIDLAPDLPRVMADRRRIVQVLTNLLANAAQHSPETSPIRVAAARDGAHVAVSVADRGEGIAPERLAHLFRRHDGAREGEGSGLGLVICKGLVEAHGGRIRAESAGAGQGMCVTFTLPVADEEVGAPAATARDPSPRDGRAKAPVLVVDDDPHSLRRVRDTLAAADYAPVVTAEPGEIAGLVETKRPALVLLDLVLPGTDGIELMQTLPALADLPVIFVSAYGRGDTVARALEAGAADYIVKPFSPAELVARVKLALARQSGPEPFQLGELVIDRATRPGHRGRAPGAAHCHRVPAAARTVAGRGRGDDLRGPPAPGVGRAGREPTAGDGAAPSAGSARKLGDDEGKPKYILNERGLGYRMPGPEDPANRP